MCEKRVCVCVCVWHGTMHEKLFNKLIFGNGNGIATPSIYHETFHLIENIWADLSYATRVWLYGMYPIPIIISWITKLIIYPKVTIYELNEEWNIPKCLFIFFFYLARARIELFTFFFCSSFGLRFFFLFGAYVPYTLVGMVRLPHKIITTGPIDARIFVTLHLLILIFSCFFFYILFPCRISFSIDCFHLFFDIRSQFEFCSPKPVYFILHTA